jgi:hypothetical protein
MTPILTGSSRLPLSVLKSRSTDAADFSPPGRQPSNQISYHERMSSETSDESGRAQPGVDELLRALRLLERTCEPPVGVGAFDVLYASAVEVVVWYSPARPEHHSGEVAIPTAWLAAAWTALVGGARLEEPALKELGQGAAGGRWLLALLAQLPGVVTRIEPLALEWSEPPRKRHRTSRRTTTKTSPRGRAKS